MAKAKQPKCDLCQSLAQIPKEIETFSAKLTQVKRKQAYTDYMSSLEKVNKKIKLGT